MKAHEYLSVAAYATLKKRYPNMNQETVIEFGWDMLKGLHKANVDAKYESRNPQTLISRCESSPVIRWTASGTYLAYFPKANRLVANDKAQEG